MRKLLIALACLAGCAAQPTTRQGLVEDPSLARTLVVPVLSVPPPDFVPFDTLDNTTVDSTSTNRILVELPGNTVAVSTGHIVVVGDSLTVASRRYLQLLADKSGYEIQIDAVSGRKTASGINALKKLEIPFGATVVVALGTNDSNDSPNYRATIDELIAVVPPGSPVVWLTSYRKKPLDNLARALRDAQLQHPRLSVADWVSVLESRKDWFSGDNVHYTPAGNEAFANFIWEAASIAATGCGRKRSCRTACSSTPGSPCSGTMR